MITSGNISFYYNDDYTELLLLDPLILSMLDKVSIWCKRQSVTIFVTHVLRTWAENQAIYKAVNKPPPTSPHLYARAIDILLLDLQRRHTETLYPNLANYITGAFKGKGNCIDHNIGNGRHLHVQTFEPHKKVMEFQEIIKMLRLYEGEVDDSWGEGTKSALKKYFEIYGKNNGNLIAGMSGLFSLFNKFEVKEGEYIS